MDRPTYEAEDRIAEVLAAAAIAFVAMLLLWPPRFVYWTDVAVVLGETPTLVLVGVVAVVVGAWVRRTARLSPVHLLAGGVVAYLVGMVAIEVALAPTSPVHLVFYAALLGCLVAGALLWAGIERVAGGA